MRKNFKTIADRKEWHIAVEMGLPLKGVHEIMSTDLDISPREFTGEGRMREISRRTGYSVSTVDRAMEMYMDLGRQFALEHLAGR